MVTNLGDIVALSGSFNFNGLPILSFENNINKMISFKFDPDKMILKLGMVPFLSAHRFQSEAQTLHTPSLIVHSTFVQDSKFTVTHAF